MILKWKVLGRVEGHVDKFRGRFLSSWHSVLRLEEPKNLQRIFT